MLIPVYDTLQASCDPRELFVCTNHTDEAIAVCVLLTAISWVPTGQRDSHDGPRQSSQLHHPVWMQLHTTESILYRTPRYRS